MDKIGRPTRLIAYNTDVNIKRHQQGLPPVYKLIRPRTVLYSAVIALVGAVMIYTLTSRTATSLAAIHDRNPLFVRTSDGSIRNGYELRIANKAPRTRRFWLEATGLEVKVEVVGASVSKVPSFEVGPDQTREVRVLVTAPQARRAGVDAGHVRHRRLRRQGRGGGQRLLPFGDQIGDGVTPSASYRSRA